MASTTNGRRTAGNDLDLARLRIAELERRVARLEVEIEKTIVAADDGDDLAPRWRSLRRVVSDTRMSWTRESLIEKLHEWVDEYGRPPAAADWNPAQARNQGSRPEVIERWLSGEWPTYSTVMRHFGRWNNFIESAGFEGRTKPELPADAENRHTHAGHLPEWEGWRHVAHLRDRTDLTQKQLARYCGVSAAYLAMVEQGRQTNPGIRWLLALARGLDVRVEALL